MMISLYCGATAETDVACIASVSEKKKGMRGEGEGSKGNACPQTPRF